MDAHCQVCQWRQSGDNRDMLAEAAWRHLVVSPNCDVVTVDGQSFDARLANLSLKRALSRFRHAQAAQQATGGRL